jgi:hypothetical protein
MRTTATATLPGGASVRMKQLGARDAADLFRRLVSANAPAGAGGGVALGALPEETFLKIFDLAVAASEVELVAKTDEGAPVASAWRPLTQGDLVSFKDSAALMELLIRINVLDFLAGE